MTTGTHQRMNIDERAFSSGTTARFAQMIVLMLVTSGTMTLPLLNLLDADAFGCMLASGVDLGRPGRSAAFTQTPAFDACVNEHVSPFRQWLFLALILLMVAATATLFWLLPRWRTRRGKVAVLAMHDQRIRLPIERLARRVGVHQPLKIVVDPVAPTVGAAAFGRNGKPVIRLNGGLIKLLEKDPKRFQAVVLHELAHIHNRDITITYLSVALWRVFLALAAMPYLAYLLITLSEDMQATVGEWEVSENLRAQGLALLLIALTYLARLEVLRSRELYADHRAVDWGADPSSWRKHRQAEEEEQEPRRRHRIASRIGALWQTHPDPLARNKSLTDPKRLFTLTHLQFLLTGAAAMLIPGQILYNWELSFDLPTTWRQLASVVPSAILLTAVVGVALWRSAIYAALAGTRAASGIRAGIWLGSGMVLGQAFSIRALINIEWIPDYPGVYFLLIPLGVAFTWWVAQCARAWVERWRGRSVMPIVLLTLAGASLIISIGLMWWVYPVSNYYTDESMYSAATDMQYLIGTLGDGTEYPYSEALSAALLVAFLRPIEILPLVWLAVAAIWIIPLAAWMTGSSTVDRRWMARFGTQAATVKHSAVDLLSLRKILLASMLGTIAAVIGILIMKARIRPWATELGGEQLDLDLLIYHSWALVAIAIGSLFAAILASAIAGRSRLLVALIAAQIATWTGIGGYFLIALTEGCHGPLNVFRSTCGWMPHTALDLASLILLPGQMNAIAAAFIGAAVVSGVSKAMRLPSSPRARARSNSPMLRGIPVRSWGVAMLCAPLIGFAVIAETTRAHGADPITPEEVALIRAATPVPSPRILGTQIAAWLHYGGQDLTERFTAVSSDLRDALYEATSGADTVSEVNAESFDFDRLEAICVELESVVESAERYFMVPDDEAQASWQEALTTIETGARGCVTAAEAEDPQGILYAALVVTQANPHLEAAYARIYELMEAAMETEEFARWLSE